MDDEKYPQNARLLHRTKSSGDVFFDRKWVFTYLNGRDVFLKERADRELFPGIGGETARERPGQPEARLERRRRN